MHKLYIILSIFFLSASQMVETKNTPQNNVLLSNLYYPGVPVDASIKPNILVTKGWLDQKKLTQIAAPTIPKHVSAQTLFGLEDKPLNRIEKNRILDLEILSNTGDYSSAILRRTIASNMSSFGDIAISKMLAQPATKLQVIESRQALLYLLSNKENVYQECKSFSAQLQTIEPSVLNFWQKNTDLVEELFSGYYYSLPGLVSLNTQTVPLSARSISSNFQYLSAVGILPLQIGWHLSKKPVRDVLKNLKPHLTLNNFKNLYKTIPQTWSGLSSDAKAAVYILSGITVTLLGITAVCDKLIYDQFCQDCQVVNYMQEQLISVAQLVKIADSIIALSKKHPEFGALPSLEASRQLLTTPGTPISTLLNKLRTNTFTGSPSYFSINGRIRATYTLMLKEKDGLRSLFNLVGEMEAMQAIASNIKRINSADDAKHICFVEFVKNDGQPYLQLDNFWNLFVGQDNAVTNSIELGHGAPSQNMLLTGSNTGGKSTTLKAIMINALLAHCFGIAYASTARMTPFHYLGTSLNISDDTAGGKSLFKSEVLRSQSILKDLKELAKNQFGLIIIDELFVGTAASVGEQAAYEFAKKLALELPNVIVCFATHFPLLTELEVATNGIYKNFKQEIYINELGQLVRPFKLEEGISTHNVAMNIFDECNGE